MNAAICLILGLAVCASRVAAAEPAATRPASEDDERRLRQNVVDSLVAAYQVDADAVRALLARQRPDGTFDGIDYAGNDVASWQALRHLDHLRLLAVAYVASDSPIKGDAALRDAIVRAYAHWVGKTPAYRNSNWWYNEIGMPIALSESMLLMQSADLLPAERFATAAALVDQARPSQSSMSATNRMWLAYATRNEGVLRALQPGVDGAERAAAAELVARSCANIASTFVVTDADGIQRDGSYHAHGPMLYDGGYGLSWVRDAGRVAAQAAGTRYRVSADAARVLIDYLLDGAQWMDRGDGIDPLTMGREISRQQTNERALVHLGAAVQALAIGDGYRADELRALRARLEAALSAHAFDAAHSLVGDRAFPRSDYLVHQRPEGMFSVKTMSTRTATPESINGENLLGAHLYAGVALIQRTGNEYDGIAPAWDWSRLPGTTTSRGASLAPPPSKPAPRGATPFAGGASDGLNGLVGFAQDYRGVSAKKSWAMFDRAMVCLGAEIASASDGPVGTSVEQTRLNGEVRYSTAAGRSETLDVGGSVRPKGLRWVHHAGVGYFFVDPTDAATITARVQSGLWRRLNHSQSDANVEVPVFGIDLDHGTRPAAAAYAWFAVVGIEAGEMDAELARRPFAILRNDASVQAVRDEASGHIAATFYAPAGFAAGPMKISLRAPATGASLLIDRAAGGDVVLHAADPCQTSATLNFELNVRLEGDGATWDAARGVTTVSFPPNANGIAGGTTTQRLRVAD